jgi:hypothetical protein
MSHALMQTSYDDVACADADQLRRCRMRWAAFETIVMR